MSKIIIRIVLILVAGVFGGLVLDERFQLKFPVFILVLPVLAGIISMKIYQDTKTTEE